MHYQLQNNIETYNYYNDNIYYKITIDNTLKYKILNKNK